jgi:signal transduction histidine kinase
MKLPFSLRASLSASMVGLVLLVAVVALAIHAALAVRGTLTQSVQRTRSLAQQAAWLASRAAAGSATTPEAAIQADAALGALFESALAGDPGIYDLALTDHLGLALVHSQPGRVGQPIPRRPPLADLLAGNVVRQGLRLLGPPLAYDEVVPLGGAERRFGEVRVGVSTALLRVELLESLLPSLWVMGAALVLAIAIALAFAQLVSQRVRAMMSGVERLREGEFGYRLAVEGQDELALLASSINALGERLEATRRRAAAGEADPSELLVATGQLSAWARVVSGLAHELADPLNAAALHLGRLKSRWKDQPPESGRHLKVLEDELKRLEQIVLGFRRFSLLGEMRSQWFDLRALLEEVVERARETAGRRIEIRLLADQAPERFWGDGALLRQALSNLISNAAQAMPGGGRVTVSAQPGDGTLGLLVADQGIGIPPEMQARVFEHFFTTKEEGSGIGLAVVQQVVKLHGGRIRLTSKPGEGTEVLLELPSRQPEAVAV